MRKYAKLSLWSDQQRESLVDVARKAFAKTKCHDATSLAWILRDLTENGALVWDDYKPTHRKTFHIIASDLLDHIERQGLVVRESSGWYRRRQ
jgi:hypothetical protein